MILSSRSPIGRWFGRISLLFGGGMLAACHLQHDAGAATHSIEQPITRTVAITFDDLPYARAEDADPATRAQARKTDAAIRAALARHAAPATGFVNETKVRSLGATGVAIVRAWSAGDLSLGNHGFSHADSNTLTLEQIEDEILAGEATIRPVAQEASRPLRFYRFAYNHVGESEDRRLAVEQLLGAHGYRLAASTIDTSDYLFDQAYERAIAADDRLMQEKIEAAYLDYSRVQVIYYAALNRQALGYEPPEVMLLHANRLNAAVLDALLGMFRDLGYGFVSLNRAQSHVAYAQAPKVATKFGPMWGYRWARERKVTVNGRLEQDPPEWLIDYASGD